MPSFKWIPLIVFEKWTLTKKLNQKLNLKLNLKLNQKLNQKLNRPRHWRWRRSDDNSSTLFLRKVELKTVVHINVWMLIIYSKIPSRKLKRNRISYIEAQVFENTPNLKILWVWCLFVCLFVWWCLTPFSGIVQLFRGGQFYWWRKSEVPGEKHRLAASDWQTLSHNVLSSTPRLSGILTHKASDDWHWLHR